MKLGHAHCSPRKVSPSSELPRLAVFDTHDHNIVKFVHRNFGANVLAEDNAIECTKEVLSTVLRYHYGDCERHGGYGNRICIGAFETLKYLEGARAYFKAAGYALAES
jgi:hypothetical protein